MIGSPSPRAADIRVKCSQRWASAARRSSCGEVRSVGPVISARNEPEVALGCNFAQHGVHLPRPFLTTGIQGVDPGCGPEPPICVLFATVYVANSTQIGHGPLKR